MSQSLATPPLAADSSVTTPTVRRRLAALLYEAVILFGVVFIAGYLFSTLTQQRNGLTHHNLLAAWIGLVVGLYFVWFWTHSGQTLPMKTWHLRVVAANGAPLSASRAMVRYVLAWLWFLPPLALHPLLSLAVPQTLVIAAIWFALWAATGRVGPQRQFLHDRLAGTRVISVAG
ncbi:RDD family protein [Paraburkholderia sp. IW21]|uniref:RDD family protein n=1 Tax=Paraburkholderia sp. IW21 TaxID=3242488 RepID=UPI00352199BB